MSAISGVTLCPQAVLRSSGVPLAVLDQLVDPGLVGTVDGGGPEVETAAGSAVARAGDAVRELCQDELVRHAAAVSHPAIFANAIVPLADGARRRGRKRLRSAVALLQRLAVKNDTANGFGPMDLVTLGGEVDLSQPVAALGRCSERAGLVSAWVVAHLAGAVSRDPDVARWLPERLPQVARVTGTGLVVGGRAVRLSASERTALAGLGRAAPDDPARLGRLRRAGVLERHLLIHTATTDPLRWLADDLRGIPDAGRWVAELDHLRGLAQRTAQAPPGAQPALIRAVRERIERLAGPLPPRPEAAFYTDREVLYQEGRAAATSYTVGGQLAGRIRTAMGSVGLLAAAYGHARFQDLAAQVRSVAGPGEIALVDLLARLSTRPGWEAETTCPRSTALVAALRDAWLGTGGLTGDQLAELLSGWPMPEFSLFSPDLMLAARAPGDLHAPDLVVGELHGGLHTFGLFEHFWPGSGMARWAATQTPLAGRTAQLVSPRSHGKAFLPELPTRSIEFRARSTRPDPVPIGQVRVRWAGGVPRLKFPEGEERTLVSCDPTNPLLAALSPHAGQLPRLVGGAHTPRLTLDGVIVQRECWRLPAPVTGRRELAAQFIEARRWRAAAGLPERVFVRTAGSPKPFLLDFSNPLLVDLFRHWTTPGALVELTEVLPDTDQLWLERGGALFTSEIRMSAGWEA